MKKVAILTSNQVLHFSFRITYKAQGPLLTKTGSSFDHTDTALRHAANVATATNLKEGIFLYHCYLRTCGATNMAAAKKFSSARKG